MTIDWSEVAAHASSKRQRVAHTCPVCGRGFVGIKTARYCSNKCRQKAKRQRRPPASQ